MEFYQIATARTVRVFPAGITGFVFRKGGQKKGAPAIHIWWMFTVTGLFLDENCDGVLGP
jgi:hypothetical protein